MVSKHLGGGTFPDVAFHAGRWVVAWQSGVNLHLVSLEPGTLDEQSWTSWTIGEPGAFPRLMSWVGRLWLAHREAVEPYRILAREVGTSHIEVLSAGHGADPVALGAGDIAWQATGAPEWQVWRKPLVGTEPSRFVRQGRPTGLSRVLSDGGVKTVDEDREMLPGYTRPCLAGDLVVAEGRNLGAYARLLDGRELVLWPGQEAVTPRCAWDGADRFGIATWGAREGVRFAEVTRAEFRDHVETGPVEDTSGQAIDPLPYMFGELPRRDGAHPMCWYVDPIKRRWYELKFANLSGDSWEGFYWTDSAIGLFEDRSQSEPTFDPPWDYAFTEDVWMTRPMRPGQKIQHDGNRLIRFDPRNNQMVNLPGMPFRYETRLGKAYLSYPFGGAVGTRPAIEVEAYALGTRYFERHTYAFGVGRCIWQAIEVETGRELHKTTFTEIGGPALTPTVGGRDSNQWPPPVEDDMNAPGVTIDRWGAAIGPVGSWSVEFHDRNNPGISGKVEIVNGSVHVTMTNPEGSDRSGNKRQVEIRA